MEFCHQWWGVLEGSFGFMQNSGVQILYWETPYNVSHDFKSSLDYF